MMKVCSLLFTSPFIIPYSMFCGSKQILKSDFFKKLKCYEKFLLLDSQFKQILF